MSAVERQGRTPLGQLIEEARLDRSIREVARASGLPASTLQYYAGPRWPAVRLPSPEVMQAIADGLRIPLVKVQQAALESLRQSQGTMPGNGTGQAMASLTTAQTLVLTAMEGMPDETQDAIADLVLRMGDLVRKADPLVTNNH